MFNTSPLATIADNPVVFEALSNLLFDKFDDYSSYAGLPANASNELLGQYLRARIEGRAKVEEALREIAQHSSVKEQSTKKNPAR